MSEVLALRAQLQELQDEVALRRDIKPIIEGKLPIGDKPGVVAHAIRKLYPIPLKYTQSHMGLKALYNWSICNRDTQMIRWTTNQVIQVLGMRALEQFRRDIQEKQSIPDISTTPRQDFLDSYRTLRPPGLDKLISQTPDGFWLKQLKRIGNANCIRVTRLIGEPNYLGWPELLPLYETMKLAVRLDHDRPGSGIASAIASELNLSPYVALPCLVEIHSPLMDWQMIYASDLLRRGLFKKLGVPGSVLVTALKLKNAPEALIQELAAKYC
jgi:hypothetical protein